MNLTTDRGTYLVTTDYADESDSLFLTGVVYHGNIVGRSIVDGIASGIRTPNRLQRKRNWRRWRAVKRYTIT